MHAELLGTTCDVCESPVRSYYWFQKTIPEEYNHQGELFHISQKKIGIKFAAD